MPKLPIFLSCLCGSEQDNRDCPGALHFLSCLCGSELSDALMTAKVPFLSCLCGSEQKLVTANEKL
ncbi:TPA: hypothetical protein ACMDN6_003311, partial [Vibrio metschnikovii]